MEIVVDHIYTPDEIRAIRNKRQEKENARLDAFYEMKAPREAINGLINQKLPDLDVDNAESSITIYIYNLIDEINQLYFDEYNSDVEQNKKNIADLKEFVLKQYGTTNGLINEKYGTLTSQGRDKINSIAIKTAVRQLEKAGYTVKSDDQESVNRALIVYHVN